MVVNTLFVFHISDNWFKFCVNIVWSSLCIFIFGRPFVKWFTLCYWTIVLSCLSVCDVGVLWPNSWMDQDKTWHRGGPRPRPHCVRWGPASPTPQKRAQPPIFGLCLLWPNGWMDQDALGTKVDLSPGHIVLDGDPAPPERGTAATLFVADVCCGQTVTHLSYCWALVDTTLCLNPFRLNLCVYACFWGRSV